MSVQIEKSTLVFLENLKKHNDREWFQANKKQYEAAKANFYQIINALLKEISRFDKPVAEVEVKDCVFRINRDIRFSKDKSPYKTNFGALLSGKQNLHKAAYYMHISPEEVYLAGGVYRPEIEALKAIRQEISYNGEAFLKILHDKKFKHYFVLENENSLTRPPAGYEKNNPMIAYLKCREMIAIHYVDKSLITSGQLIAHCAEAFQALLPLNSFLNNALSDLEV